MHAHDIMRVYLNNVYRMAILKTDMCLPSPLSSDECGIVAQVSAPLAHAEISTYYICTYYTDHTLVRCADTSTAHTALAKHT